MKKIALVCLLALSSLISAENINLIVNPSFQENMRGWEYKGKGSLSLQKNQGPQKNDCAGLTAGEAFQQTGRAPDHTDLFIGLADRPFKFSAIVKGTGTVEIGARVSGAPDIKGVENFTSIELVGDWQKIEFKGQEKSPAASSLQLFIRNVDDKSLLISNPEFSFVENPDAALKMTPEYLLAAPGGKYNLKATVTEKGKAAVSAPVNIRLYKSVKNLTEIIKDIQLKTNDNGIIDYTIEIPSETSSSLMLLSASVPDKGLKKNLFISVSPPDIVKKYDALASSIKLKSPLYFLYLGDSLTDFNRGHGYTDMINYCLNKYNSGMASFRNAGVGGDYITRTWDRIQGMNGSKKAWRQHMYDRLLEKKPDYIFVCLGANDTKVSSANDYTIPLVAPELQTKTYLELINYLRANSGASIVFISTPSTYFPAQQESAAKLKAAGKVHSLFGVDEHIVRFNETLKSICIENKIDYIDIYTATKNHPDKKSLFVEDGVHLSEKGNLLVAELVLEYWKSKQ